MAELARTGSMRELVTKKKNAKADGGVEARDARIGRSTAHPDLAEWVGDRPRVVVFTFADLAPPKVLSDWRAAMEEDVFFVDARRGGDKARRR